MSEQRQTALRALAARLDCLDIRAAFGTLRANGLTLSQPEADLVVAELMRRQTERAQRIARQEARRTTRPASAVLRDVAPRTEVELRRLIGPVIAPDEPG